MSNLHSMDYQQLQEIYQRIPNTSQCPDYCSNCCGPIPISQIEIDLIKFKYGIIIGVDSNLNCNCLKENKCSIYNDRPLICRLFNETNYGTLYCTNKLSENQIKNILEDYIEIFGQLKVTCPELQQDFII